MITEDYISFETAKLLKEKGFDEPCYRWYDTKGEVCAKFINPDIPLDYFSREYYLCPSQSMAMKWLREVHNMYYEIQLLLGEKAEKYGGLQLGIYQLNRSRAYVWKDWIYADTYVELYKNYIKYCLEHLI